MPRTKVTMKFIEDAKKRRSTYKKRLKSLVDKVSQLAVLCSVKILFVSVEPAGTAGGEREVTTWPEDRGALKELIARFRRTRPEKIKENLTPSTYLQGELGKEQCRLAKVKQCRLDDVLTLWDPRLDDLTADDLVALYHELGETLEKARQRIAKLGGGARSTVDAVTAPALRRAPTPAFPGSTFDLNLSDAGSSIGAQDSCYLPPDLLPRPVPAQSRHNGSGFHMNPPFVTFGSPPMPFMPFPMAAPPALTAPPAGFNFTGGVINFMDPRPAATAGFYDDFAMQGPGQGFAGGGAGAYNQDFPGYGFDATSGNGVWPLGNSVGTNAYQLKNGAVIWPDSGVGHLALAKQEEQSRLLRRFDPWM